MDEIECEKNVMNIFRSTPKTEIAFLLAYRELSNEQVEELKTVLGTERDDLVFPDLAEFFEIRGRKSAKRKTNKVS